MDRTKYDTGKFGISKEDWAELYRLDKEFKGDSVNLAKETDKVLKSYELKLTDKAELRTYLRGVSGAYTDTEVAELDKKDKRQTIIFMGVSLVVVLVGLFFYWSKPDPCDCVDLLMLKRNNLDYVYGMSNETFRKWEDCYDAYAGPAGATLECMEQ